MLIDATHPEETRVVVVDGTKVEDFDFESVNKRQLAGNIYLAKVTRVEPSLQAAFVEYGGNRHGFLAFAEIHPDYYQIPVADREALLAAEEADNRADDEEEERSRSKRGPSGRKNRNRRGSKPRDGAEAAAASDAETEVGSGAEASAIPDATAADAAAAPFDDAEPQSPDRESAAEIGAAPVADAEAEAGPDDLAETDPDAAPDDAPPPRAMTESSGADGADRVSEDYPSPADASDADASANEAPSVEAEPAAETTAEAGPDSGSGDAGAEPGSEAAPKPARRARRSRSRRKTADAEAATTEPATTEAAAEAAPAKAASETAEQRADEAEDEQIESVGAETVEDEVRPRRVQMRRYKIQEVIKVRQIMLVQVVKEERGNKGAALTTYLSLAGRYCVLMPNTARGGGISRKITSAEDRKKLKAIAGEFEVPKGMGLIIRTAGAQRTRAEIKRDYEFLLRQWEQVRELTLKSIAPTLIYEEGSLIKRSIRDIYSKEIDEILVAGEDGYREAKDYMRMLMPSHAKFVQPYRETVPLFARYQVESYLAGMFNPTVQLRSGGYIVIGVTEALVAIDVNSGRSTREGSIEETALKTNLEAADEVARQLRLRDLAGLIVIDFIDMDERRNNAAVEKRMKERLKTDRARIQMGRISAFGLMEMSRQRLRPGMLEASTAPCPHCHGTGLIRSADSLALSILREIEDEAVRGKAREIKVVAPVQIANFLMNQKREHVLSVESRYGMSVLIEGDPALVSPEHRLERMRAASRPLPAPEAAVRAESAYSGLDDPRDAEEDEEEAPRAKPQAAPRGEEPRRADPRAAEPRAAEPRTAAPRGGDDAKDPAQDGAEGGKSRRRRGKRGGKKRRRTEEEEAAARAADPLAVFDGDGDYSEPMSVSRSAFGDEIAPSESDDDGDEDETEADAAPEARAAAPASASTEDLEPTYDEEIAAPAHDLRAAPETKSAVPVPVAETERPLAEPEPEATAPAPAQPAPAPTEPAAPRPRRTGWFSRAFADRGTT
ncbi:MAG: Rne/Rng family ribonuclease [Rubrimonas sp.]